MGYHLKKVIGILKKIPPLRPQWFWVGFSVGVIYFGIVFGWLWSLHPLTTIGITNPIWSFLIVLFVYTESVIPAAACWGLFSWLANKITSHWYSHGGVPFFLGGSFALVEYFRAWVFGIIWAGGGSSFGPNWTFGNPAYWLANFSPLAQSASWWGIYGIDFVFVVTVAAVIFCIKNKSVRQANLAVLVTLAAICGGAAIIGSQPNDGDNSIPVALIRTEKQTKISYTGDESFKDAQEKLKLIKQAAQNFESSGGIIILPEGAALSTFLNNILTPAAIQEYFRKLGPTEVLLIDNIKTETPAGLVSRTIMISSRDGLIASKDKRVIAPGGEYLPYLAKVLLAAGNWMGLNFKYSVELSSGDKEKLFTAETQRVKASFITCSDALSPDLVRDKNASVVLGVNSLALFRGNRWLDYQLLTTNKMRAIENRSWLAWSSNFGHAYILGPTGKIVLISKETGYGILTGSVVPRKQPAWYTYVGDWPVLLVSLTLVGISFRRRNAS